MCVLAIPERDVDEVVKFEIIDAEEVARLNKAGKVRLAQS